MLQGGNLRAFVEILLREYYDPLYRKSQLPEQDYELIVQAEDLEAAVFQIEHYLRSHYPAGKFQLANGLPQVTRSP